MTRLLFILVIVFISGCQSIQKPNLPPEELWKIHEKKLEKINEYQASGSFSYVSKKNKHHARFYWEQKAENDYYLQISTPLGGKIVSIYSNQNGARLIDKKGKEYRDETLEILLEKLAKIQLPLTHLPDLLIGLHRFDESETILNNEKLDKNQRISANLDDFGLLKQAKITDNLGNLWQIDFKEYTKKYNLMLPREIQLRSNDVDVNLKINNWNFK